jgi:hypothetical protein
MEDVGLIFCHLVYFMAIWHTVRRFGMLHQENLATLL